MGTARGPSSEACSCKIGRNIEKYELGDFDDALIDKRQKEEMSLRDLASYINSRILESAIDSKATSVVGDPMTLYTSLTGDDISPERRADVRDDLEYAGVDIDKLEEDFVSHQTVKTHLQDCLDLDTSRQGVEILDDAKDLIEWTRNRDERIIKKTLQRLRDSGEIQSGQLDITHTVNIRCEECGTNYRLEEFLQNEGCECSGREKNE